MYFERIRFNIPLVDDFDDTSIRSIGHLGIIAGAYDSLQIADVIDAALPKTRRHHLSHAQVLKAMILNGLGFVERRLYLFPEFFDDIAVERLLGEGVACEHLNDDVLGRTLDAIAAYGPTKLFNEIVASCLLPTDFGSHYHSPGSTSWPFGASRLRESLVGAQILWCAGPCWDAPLE